MNFKGLFGEQVNPLGPFGIHHESLLTRSMLYDFEIQEHLHVDLVQLFFITSGGGYLLNSGKRVPLESPCVIIIPSHTLHGFAFQSKVKGEVFTISEAKFDAFLKNGQPFFSSFDQLSLFTFEPQASSFGELIRLKNHILEELVEQDKSSELSLNLLFQLFLLGLYRFQKVEAKAALQVDNRTLNHFRTFKKLIKLHISEERKVKFYAQKMNLSMVHLNRICKATTNQTALQIIHDQLLSEAKKFLSGSSYSVAEIAYFLGFKDPSHFSKFFKKKEGITALGFRKGLG